MRKNTEQGPFKVISGKLNSAKALLVFRLTAKDWSIPEQHWAGILGLSQEEWDKMHALGRFPSMDHEATHRSVGFVASFFHIARIVGAKTTEHLEWAMKPNQGKPFNGKTPVAYYKEAGTGGIYLVYDMLASTPPKSAHH